MSAHTPELWRVWMSNNGIETWCGLLDGRRAERDVYPTGATAYRIERNDGRGTLCEIPTRNRNLRARIDARIEHARDLAGRAALAEAGP